MAFAVPAEVLAIFRDEVRGYFDVISDAVTALEQPLEPERRAAIVRDVARKLHNIKGAAASVDMSHCAKVAHATEEMLLREAREAGDLSHGLALLVRAVTWMQEALDNVDLDAEDLLKDLAGGAPRPAPQSTPTPVGQGEALPDWPAEPRRETPTAETQPADATTSATPSSADEFVRIEVSKLERMLRPLAVQVTQGNANRYHASALGELVATVRALGKQAAQGELGPADSATFEQLASALDRHTRSLENGLRVTGHTTRDLEEHIRAMRLLPLAAVERGLALIVRDAAARTGKNVRFVLRGGDVGIDRHTLEVLRPALTHLVRNAVDHGLETTSERQAAGKSEHGTVQLSASTRGDSLEIAVSDDGAGIDLERVSAQAVRRGIPDGQSDEAFESEALLDLLAQHGFSTAAKVTELSGRGVGLDVVRRDIQTLGGQLSLSTHPGAGTRFILTLPARLLTSRVLLVRAGGQLYGVPLAGVEAASRVAAKDFYLLEDQTCVNVAGTPARVRRLGRPPLVEETGAEDEGLRQPALLIRTGQGPYAVVVDAIVGEDDVVVGPLGPPLRSVHGVRGVALAESGNVMLVLYPPEIHRLGQVDDRSAADARPTKQAVVLVVDDSITTRTLERHILESNGYLVKAATDGLEALRVLRSAEIDVMVADVEMPNLNGLELARAVREDATLADLPLILVTSRGSDEDQRRGLAAGADAYIVKRDFDQTELLATVETLLRDAR